MPDFSRPAAGRNPSGVMGGSTGAGGGGPPRGVVELWTAGSHNVAGLDVPSGQELTVELWGAGGSGGGADNPNVGDGGASGGYLKLLVPAALWALGGTIVVADGTMGGSADEPGTDGLPTVLTLNAIVRGSAAGGGYGAGADSPTAGGAHGTNATGAGVTELASDDGADGTERGGAVPGAGGVNTTSPAFGRGGNAAPLPSGNGEGGQIGHAKIWWGMG